MQPVRKEYMKVPLKWLSAFRMDCFPGMRELRRHLSKGNYRAQNGLLRTLSGS